MNINDIDAQYDGGPVPVGTGTYQCPVCKKNYKTLKGATNHIDKRDCYDVASLYRGTPGEYHAFGLYKQVCDEYGYRSSYNGFKKSPSYKPSLRFMAFTELNNLVAHRDSLLALTMQQHMDTIDKPNKIFIYAMYDRTILDYKKMFHSFGEAGFDNRRDRIVNAIEDSDNPFLSLTNDIEMMTVSYADAFNDAALKHIMLDAPLDYRDRLNHIRMNYTEFSDGV